DIHAAQATEEPEEDENDQYQAENTAESRPAIPVVAVVATTAAEQHDHQDDNQDCAHCPPSLQPPDMASGRSALQAKSLSRYSSDSLNAEGRANHSVPYLISGSILSVSIVPPGSTTLF